VEQYGAIGIFFLSIIEEIAIPIPSSLPFLAAGFFMLPASSSFGVVAIDAIFTIAIPGAFGLSIGSLFGYLIAFHGGELAIKKWGRYIGVSWQSVERFREKLSTRGTDEFVIFMLRAIPFFPNMAISIGCGLIHYEFKRYLVITLIGGFFRALSMALFGWYIGAAYADYVGTIGNVGLYTGVGIAGIVAVWLLVSFIRKRF
jgi:membrane protein DedA with SNARE-associated domain